MHRFLTVEKQVVFLIYWDISWIGLKQEDSAMWVMLTHPQSCPFLLMS